MTVITDRHTYFFDLVASPLARDPLYVLSFTYPPEKAQPKLASAGPSAAPTERRARRRHRSLRGGRSGQAQLRVAPEGRGQAVARAASSTTAKRPSSAGRLGATLPGDPDQGRQGHRGPGQLCARGDVIVVDGVPPEIVLRSGAEDAPIVNEGPPRPAHRAQAAPRAGPVTKWRPTMKLAMRLPEKGRETTT